ncbi:Peptidase family M23 [Flavobacterium fryxellicola]|uniref:Peptidase M23 n=1 Tax=Flavobacterium fryxellicola TaxID=249352 RepID=A0A167XXZ4_9FLAO|nr:M23 family metallopeptidase [Flavobacterium fryxellicola]OAB28807.1 peptidase M23 [Flavobacterium fryxellicola]SHN61545.1 Peptidase family M23 [Flavobacterium fryxellicola]
MRFSIFFLFFSSAILAQVDYPKDYFRPPLDIPMQLSGNFGELRPNHFHAGFDLRTQQKEGLKVFAVADGYVSRIKISTFGNGKTIYINHPNGYTSVYGHLKVANGEIESFIKKTHYKEQSFEIEMFFKPDEMVVKKGDVIAFSGNTGSSEGPHLHFEFRDSKTEFVINPMLFGYNKFLRDTKKPTVSGVYVYPLDSKTTVNRSKRPLLLNVSLQKDGTYLADKVVANGAIGFGISAYDSDDVSFNNNGVYKVQSFYNGKPNFGFEFNTYSFDEMRYINALIDYSKYKKMQQRVLKLFMKAPSNLSIIHADENKGVLQIAPNLASLYRVEVSDYFGNLKTISIPIQYDLLPTVISPEPIQSNYLVKANKDSNFSLENMSVFFPAGTFYEDFAMNFDVKNDTLFLHDDTVPAHSNFTISIEDTKSSEALREKTFIGRIEGNKINYNPTYRKDGLFTTKVKILGKYALIVDTTAPKISIATPIEGKWISDQKTIQLAINDAGSGIKSYNGYLNGKWVLFEYDHKTKKLTHFFSDGIASDGGNDLKVVVVDNVGNSTTFETRFFRSQK